jgi:hypothetical protein
MVALSITAREVMGEALQGVGGVHSTADPGDSTTPEKGRGSACLHQRWNVMRNSIPQRGTRI